MFGQTRLEFIFGMIIFAIIILYLINQINTIFSSMIEDYDIDTMKAKAVNAVNMLLGTQDIERNYTVQVPVDVILITDISSSMMGDGSPWGTNCRLPCTGYCTVAGNKSGDPSPYACPDITDCNNDGNWNDQGETPCSINDAKTASNFFVDLLNSTNDQSGLVTFNTTAYLNQFLTNDTIAVKSAIDSLKARDDTAIAYGIGNATEELMSARARDYAKKVEILLTDGRDYPHLTDSLGAADDAKANNITIYTIGLGSESYLNEPLLEEIASITGGEYYHVPDSDQLTSIYESIAYEIRTDLIKIGILTTKPYVVSKDKIQNLSQNCNDLDAFDLGTYRLKIYNSTSLLLLCGTETLRSPRVVVSKYVLIENEEDMGNITLEVW